jgi:hypothetical protein
VSSNCDEEEMNNLFGCHIKSFTKLQKMFLLHEQQDENKYVKLGKSIKHFIDGYLRIFSMTESEYKKAFGCTASMKRLFLTNVCMFRLVRETNNTKKGGMTIVQSGGNGKGNTTIHSKGNGSVIAVSQGNNSSFQRGRTLFNGTVQCGGNFISGISNYNVVNDSTTQKNNK